MSCVSRHKLQRLHFCVQFCDSCTDVLALLSLRTDTLFRWFWCYLIIYSIGSCVGECETIMLLVFRNLGGVFFSCKKFCSFYIYAVHRKLMALGRFNEISNTVEYLKMLLLVLCLMRIDLHTHIRKMSEIRDRCHHIILWCKSQLEVWREIFVV